MTLLVAVKVYDLPVAARIRSAQAPWSFVVAVKLLAVDEVHATDRTAPSANRQRIVNLFPTAHRLLFVVSSRHRIAYSRARPLLALGFRDPSSAPPVV
jgi:hypothetical protein